LHHPPSPSSSSLFGVGNNLERLVRRGRRQRCLASVVAAYRIRGGSGDDDDDDEENGDSDGNAVEERIAATDDGDEERRPETTAEAALDEDASDDDGGKNKDDDDDDRDEERYSRQMYALGARAHGLVRSTTAVLDGPLGGRGGRDVRAGGADGFDGLDDDGRDGCRPATDVSRTPSGLLYEIAKNLALSGVGRIVLVRDDDDDDVGGDSYDSGYFDGSLDDLGAAYHRSALAEIGGVDSGSDRQGERTSPNEDDGEEEGDSDVEEGYDGSLDDGATLLAEYIQRLNPGVKVDVVPRSDLLRSLDDLVAGDGDDDDEASSDDEREGVVSLGTNPVVVCVDRSTTAQLEMNDACRGYGRSDGAAVVPFVSVETAGVHARLFCDFGPDFVVVDEDGETPRSTLLDRVEEEEKPPGDDGNEKLYTVQCLEDDRHDVSRDDIIEFQGEHGGDSHLGGKTDFPKCQVVTVKSPRCFTVKEWRDRGESKGSGADGNKTDSSKIFSSLLEGRARSFSRVKVPKRVSFSSLRHILQPSTSEKGQGSVITKRCWDDDALFAPSDLDKSFDPLRRRAVMASMSALDAFVRRHGRLPSKSRAVGQRTDAERFRSLVRRTANEDDGAGDSSTKPDEKRRWESLVDQFARTCRAKFAPVQALSGALGAQEALKAATGLYNPVRQFLLYDCDEVLQGDPSEGADDDEEVEGGTTETACDLPKGQTYILGERTSRKLAGSRLFLVGAGAIGCELLKNLAAMGAGTNGEGRIVLTDMDTIEKSNLSRQLLFRDHDVGEFKSVAARTATSRFNPRTRVEAHTCRVGEEEEGGGGPFDDDFWSVGCDVVLNALDNVEARLFVDSMCVAHGLGMVDAGTLGPKGNVQAVVPGLSESYGSSADPPEPNVPVCTLKNFPYEIAHTIQWARDLFDGYFRRRPRQANDHVEELAEAEDLGAFGRALMEKLGEDAAADMAKELGEDLGPFPFVVGNADASDPEYVSTVKKVSLEWAIREAHRLFYVAMDELIRKHPADSVDDDGAAFWSGTRRMPRPLRFTPLDSEEDEVSAQQVIINERIAQFVRSAARLRMESFLPADENESSLTSLEEALIALEEQAKLLYAKKKPKEILHNLSGGGSNDDGDDAALSLIVENLNGAKAGASFLPSLNLADFEKDDESNGHVAFVAAASNLRAAAYGIPPADAMETRRVAGRIVPAMITTTGLVSALSCVELVKAIRGSPLELRRNAFVNLALPFFAFTAPVPAEEVTGLNGKTHTIWDRITVKDKSPTRTMTLGKFLRKVRKKAGCGEGVEVSSLSHGPFMIYANFLHAGDEELLGTPLLDAVRDAVMSEDDDDMSFLEDDIAEEGEGEEEEPPSAAALTAEQKAVLAKLERKRFIDFAVTVEDQETGEEFELPPVRLIKDKEKERTYVDDEIEDTPQ